LGHLGEEKNKGGRRRKLEFFLELLREREKKEFERFVPGLFCRPNEMPPVEKRRKKRGKGVRDGERIFS